MISFLNVFSALLLSIIAVSASFTQGRNYERDLICANQAVETARIRDAQLELFRGQTSLMKWQEWELRERLKYAPRIIAGPEAYTPASPQELKPTPMTDEDKKLLESIGPRDEEAESRVIEPTDKDN